MFVKTGCRNLKFFRDLRLCIRSIFVVYSLFGHSLFVVRLLFVLYSFSVVCCLFVGVRSFFVVHSALILR